MTHILVRTPPVAARMPGVPTEHLYALDTRDRDRKKLTHLREVTAVEASGTKRAAVILQPLSSESPHARLRKEADRLSESMEAALRTRGTATILEAGKAIQRQFGIWLSSFRSCDDRTAHQLSRAFGKDSPELAAFKTLTNEEYDRNFAYRVCWQLRNAEQHVAEVINAMRMDYDDGAYTLVSQIDPHALVASFPDLKAAVRDELNECEGNLELISLVRSVMVGWSNNIHCGLLLAVWDDIQPLVELCTTLHEEALAAGGEWAVFYDAGPDELPALEVWSPPRHNPYQHAELVARNLPACQRAVADQPPDFPAELFVAGDEPLQPPI